MNLKRNIAVCLACILLVGLGAAMILSGCGEETPIPDGGTTVGGTTAGTGETTQPGGNGQTQPTQGQQGTDPTGSTTDSTPPPDPTNPTNPSQPAEKTYLTYEEYIALSGAEQNAYCQSFPSLRAFNDWYNAAKKAYDEAQPKETIGPDGNINLD